MKRFLFFLSFILPMVLWAVKPSKTLLKSLDEQGIFFKENAIIIGVNGTDCDLHNIELGNICKYLNSENNISNVYFVTVHISNFGSYIKNKFKTTPPKIKVVENEHLFKQLSANRLGSFCVVLNEKQLKRNELSYFNENKKLIEKKYEIGLLKSIIIDDTSKNGIRYTNYIVEKNYILINSFINNEVYVFNKKTGKKISYANSNNLQIPRKEISKNILINEVDNYNFTQLLENQDSYTKYGLLEYKIEGISTENDKIYLCLDYFYFDNIDSAILHTPVIIEFDTLFQYKNHITIEDGGNEVKKDHHLRTVLNGQTIFNNQFYSSNSFHGNREDFSFVSKYNIVNNTAKKNTIKLFPVSQKISQKVIKEKVALLTDINHNGYDVLVSYHTFPIVHFLRNNNSIEEIQLEDELFKKSKNLHLVEGYYIYNLTRTTSNNIIANVRKNKQFYLNCYDMNGKLTASENITDLKTKELPKNINPVDFYYVLDKNEQGKLVINEFVIY